jgi:hypothetical protein
MNLKPLEFRRFTTSQIAALMIAASRGNFIIGRDWPEQTHRTAINDNLRMLQEEGFFFRVEGASEYHHKAIEHWITPDGRKALDLILGDWASDRSGSVVKLLQAAPVKTPINVLCQVQRLHGLLDTYSLSRPGFPPGEARYLITAWRKAGIITATGDFHKTNQFPRVPTYRLAPQYREKIDQIAA